LDANTENRWAASSGVPITLDGQVVLDVEASANAIIAGNWDDEFDVEPFSILAVEPNLTFALAASVPVDGGPITISTRSGPFQTRGLDFTTSNGTLTAGGSAAPYETVTTNTSNQWAVKSNTAVTVDGSIVLDVAASSGANISGLVWDGSNNPLRIGSIQQSSATLRGSYAYDGGPVTIRSTGGPVAAKGLNLTAASGTLNGGGSAAPFDTIGTNTANEWSVNSSVYVSIDGRVELDVVASGDANIKGQYNTGANSQPFAVDRSAPVFTSKLIGEFPLQGGPITIEPQDGPVVTRGLDLNATRGTLTGGGSAAPYESVVNNTVSRWSVNSSTDVTIDGPVVLDVLASPDAQFEAFVNDGATTNRFSLFRGVPDEGDSPLIGTFPPEGGKITVTTTQGPIETNGIEFVAPEGDLTQGEDPAPFQFFLTSRVAPENVLFAAIVPVTLDGSLELDVTARAEASIEGNWGDGPVPRPFPVSNRPFVGGTESKLVGTIPFDGGAISLAPQNEPVTTRGLNIEAVTGSLAGGGGAAPYETLVSNTPQKWTVESSADVTIDGPIELDVAASKAANLIGEASKVDGVESISFVRENPEFTDRIYGSYAANGGPISIVAPNGPVSTRSVDLSALSTSSLSSGGSAAPYERVVTDNSKRWTAISNADVVIDGVVTLDVVGSPGRRSDIEHFEGLVTDATTTSRFAVAERQPIGGLVATFPYDGGSVTLSGSGQQINNLDMTASAGSLTGGGDASPFSTVSANTSQQWSVSSDVSVLIDGLIQLDVLASADAQIAGAVSNEFDNEEILVRRLGPQFTSSLVGNFDHAGGPVSLTSVNGPVSIQSLQLSATRGGLTGGTTAAPFDTVVTNSSDQWIAESLASVVVDGTVELSVQADQGTSINGIFYDGTESLSFALSRNGFDPGDGGFGNVLTAFYPPWGGRIALIAGDGPVNLGGIEFVAEPGILTQGESPAPFSFFLPNSAAPGNVTLASLGTPVTVDGFLELNVFVAPNTPNGSIVASWGDGINPTGFPVVQSGVLPEPSSGLMTWFGILGLLVVRRRR